MEQMKIFCEGMKVVLFFGFFFGCLFFLFVCLFVCFFLLWPHLWPMELPRLGAEWELQLLTCATATAMWDLSHVCDLHHSTGQRWIPNLLREARDGTHILMNTRWVLNPLSHNGNSNLDHLCKDSASKHSQ